MASVIGSLLVQTEKDQQDLLLKAMFDASRRGLERDRAMFIIAELRALLEQVL